MAVVTYLFPRLRHRRIEQLYGPESKCNECDPEDSSVAEDEVKCKDCSDVGKNLVGGKGPQH